MYIPGFTHNSQAKQREIPANVTMLTTEVGSRKETSPSEPTATEKAVEQTPAARDKAAVVRKRPLSQPPSSENSDEVCGKKMRADEEAEDSKSDKDMQPFKGIMAALGEICNVLLKIAALEASQKKLAAAEVMCESAMKKVEESGKWAEKAKRALKDMNFTEYSNNLRTMARENAEMYQDLEVAGKEFVAAKLILAQSSLNKDNDSDNRAEKAENDNVKAPSQSQNDVKIAFQNYITSAIETAVARAMR